jgi:hypothetical protein
MERQSCTHAEIQSKKERYDEGKTPKELEVFIDLSDFSGLPHEGSAFTIFLIAEKISLKLKQRQAFLEIYIGPFN